MVRVRSRTRETPHRLARTLLFSSSHRASPNDQPQRVAEAVAAIHNQNSITSMFQKIDYPFLVATFVSFLASVALWFLVNREYGLFVGLWVPSILSLWVGVRVVLLTSILSAKRRS